MAESIKSHDKVGHYLELLEFMQDDFTRQNHPFIAYLINMTSEAIRDQYPDEEQTDRHLWVVD
ncbi:MAG: hypothetical protein H6882_08665 [Rhodobiaceae bacterium]|nr:hypothetical protein [Rhodobiaceae bacterium]